MKNTTTLILGMVACLSASTAFAENSSFRESVISASASRGVGGSLEVLERVTGPGREARAAQVLDGIERAIPKLSGRTVVNTRQFDDTMFVQGEGFVLEVRGDGNSVRFEALGKKAPGVPLEARIGSNELEQLGRRFIQSELGDQLKLAGDESLELWRTSYEIEIEGSETGDTHRSVVASRVVFTRAVRGVPVLGAGSKVSVTFDNDKTPVGFSYDWSELRKTDAVEAPASLETVHARRRALASQRIKKAGEEVNLESMECGYYDSGARAGSGTIRSACVAFHQVVNKHKLKSMVSLEAVPAASVIPDEASWQEAAALRSQHVE